ncbi:MAG: glycosyltransferase [Flavobacteriales bacterium]|nr:glycosyltransferase [Flavobacteriales bacterium]NNK81209.1 glycosyltransferase [Flavobacteriales bacterium]
MSFPKVSVCIPIYNGESFLQEALDSIAAQDFQDIEVIISDDNSKDRSLELCRVFKDCQPFPVHIFSHRPSGIGANWNNCLDKAQGEYIKFLFQDDVLEPDCISSMVEVLYSNDDIGLVASKRNFLIESSIDQEFVKRWIGIFGDLQTEFEGEKKPFLRLTRSIFGKESFAELPLNKIGEPSAVMFRKKFFETLGPFREDLKQSLDYEYWYRILNIAAIAILPDKLVGFRLHAGQATNSNRKQGIIDYEAYDRILYDKYLPLLHKSTRRRLVKKYNPAYLLKDKVMLKLKLTRKKWSS